MQLYNYIPLNHKYKVGDLIKKMASEEKVCPFYILFLGEPLFKNALRLSKSYKNERVTAIHFVSCVYPLGLKLKALLSDLFIPPHPLVPVCNLSVCDSHVLVKTGVTGVHLHNFHLICASTSSCKLILSSAAGRVYTDMRAHSDPRTHTHTKEVLKPYDMDIHTGPCLTEILFLFW